MSAGNRIRRIASATKPMKAGETNVCVIVRCRPMSSSEKSKGYKSIVEIESDKKIVIHDLNETPSEQLGTRNGDRRNYSRVYDFDTVFGPETSQAQIYLRAAKPIVDSVLKGYNGTIFAYGQTGAGKTFTMQGLQQPYSSINKRSSNSFDDADSREGIMPRAFKQIYSYVEANKDIQFVVRASYLEIYKEQIYDLLRNDRTEKLELRERQGSGEVYVKNLTALVCKSCEDIEKVTSIGNKNRSVAATNMNEHSSRSHAILIIEVEQQKQNLNISTSKSKGEELQSFQANKIVIGKLNLIDLAGSERQRKTNSSGERQQESIKINLSLSALGNVINSLMKLNSADGVPPSSESLDSSNSRDSITSGVDKIGGGGSGVSSSKQFVAPYRDSKLTRLLQNSIGGNAKTLMIANIGPACYNHDEAIITLNYASRAKCIRNTPKLNEDASQSSVLRQMQEEIAYLREQLIAASKNEKPSVVDNSQQSKFKSQLNSENQAALTLEFETIKNKLRVLESKLLNSNANSTNNDDLLTLVDTSLLQEYTIEQQLELSRQRAEIEMRANQESEIRGQLEKSVKETQSAKQSYSTTQVEIDTKADELRSIVATIKELRVNFDTKQRDCRIELEELDQLQYELQKELKLKSLIMNNFIPKQTVEDLLKRMNYDEDSNCCVVESANLDDKNQKFKFLPFQHFAKLSKQRSDSSEDKTKIDSKFENSKCKHDTTNNCAPPLRFRTEFEKVAEALNPTNVRFKTNNLFKPALIMPKKRKRITNKLFTPSNKLIDDNVTSDDFYDTTKKIQELIELELNKHEPDITI